MADKDRRDEEEEVVTPLPPVVFQPVWPDPPEVRMVGMEEIRGKGLSLRARDYFEDEEAPRVGEPRKSWWVRNRLRLLWAGVWLVFGVSFAVGTLYSMIYIFRRV